MFDEITPSDLESRRDNGEHWQLLDIREPWEIEIAHVPDSLCIPMSEIPSRLAEVDGAVPVAVMCHSGRRSAKVAAYLAGCGFDRVANVSGGIDAWAVDVDSSLRRY